MVSKFESMIDDIDDIRRSAKNTCMERYILNK